MGTKLESVVPLDGLFHILVSPPEDHYFPLVEEEEANYVLMSPF